jgi:SAM-dependent methyltransferase
MFADSDGYEQFMGRWSRRLAPQLVTFGRIAGGHTVLDVGCGTGALSFAAAAVPGVRVTGIDPATSFVRRAMASAGDRVRFDVGDAGALPYPDSTFDRSVSLLVLNFVPDPAAAVREMARVTRPGGVVAAAVWDYGDGMEMLRAFWDEAVGLRPAAAPSDERHQPLTRAGDLATLWRTQGLHRVEERPLSIDLAFSSFDDYWQPFCGGQGPAGAYTATLPDADRDALRSRLRSRLLGTGADCGFTLRARAWAVRGDVI